MRSRYRIHEPDAEHFITSTIIEWLLSSPPRHAATLTDADGEVLGRRPVFRRRRFTRPVAQSPVAVTGARRSPDPRPLVPKLHFGTPLSGQFHCRRVVCLRAGHPTGDGAAQTSAFRDGVAERAE